MSGIKNIFFYALIFLLIIGLCSSILGILPKFNKENKENNKLLSVPSLSVGTEIKGSNGYISFLGDSITTYDGWSNNSTHNTTIGNNTSYYKSSKMRVTDTWWYQSARELNMSLCVNNSWDGGRVTDTKEGITSGIERAKNLHNDTTNVKPDLIIVYMGTNDLANGISLYDFEVAYMSMLDNIKTSYPNAEVYCCTLLPESRTSTDTLEALRLKFNLSICNMAYNCGYNIIDFASEITDWDYTTDTFTDSWSSGTLRVHPTTAGMDKLSECVINTISRG